MRTVKLPVLVALAALYAAGPVSAADAPEKENGWKQLFNGKDLSGWMNAAGKEPGAGWVAEDGALVRKKRGGDIWTKDRYGDFVLELEFKTKGNSGVFFRTGNPRNNVQTGLEMQVERPAKKPGKHSVGAIYDALAPSKNAAKDGWNKVVLTAIGDKITVVMNGERIIDMDLSRWNEAGKNPDGTKNKYKKALKDFPRAGHIGLQDHGAEVMYRNIRIKPLGKAGAK